MTGWVQENASGVLEKSWKFLYPREWEPRNFDAFVTRLLRLSVNLAVDTKCGMCTRPVNRFKPATSDQEYIFKNF